MEDLAAMIDVIELNMLEAAETLDFEKAAELRDKGKQIKKYYNKAKKKYDREQNKN